MTRNSMRQLITKLQKRNAELEAENAQLKLEQQEEGTVENENNDSEEVQE